MLPTHLLKVDEEDRRLRLDVFLTKALPESFSRSFIKRLIDGRCVLVNGKNVKAHHKMSVHDEVSVVMPSGTGPAWAGNERIKPEEIPLDIFYEDETLLVVNKPSGMTVHPARGYYSGTLVNALLYHCGELSSLYPSRPGIVHRLDRETSGLMVVAKDNAAHANLARQFEKHLVKKSYLAWVQGILEFDEGLIDVALGPHPIFFDKKAVAFDEGAKKAKTIYRVLKRSKDKTLVQCFPKTGRTHQLRVHLAYLGYPILGDGKYGRKDSFKRLALHAQGLGFFHPKTTKYLEFSSVPPPEFL